MKDVIEEGEIIEHFHSSVNTIGQEEDDPQEHLHMKDSTISQFEA